MFYCSENKNINEIFWKFNNIFLLDYIDVFDKGVSMNLAFIRYILFSMIERASLPHLRLNSDHLDNPTSVN